jgi:hypothetical protein
LIASPKIVLFKHSRFPQNARHAAGEAHSGSPAVLFLPRAVNRGAHRMSDQNENLDLALWGAEPIGRTANVIDDDGKVDLRRTYYLLESGLLPGKKVGRYWTSTPRLLRSVTEGAVEEAARRRQERAKASSAGKSA